MKTINRYIILLVFLPLIILLASCAETAENDHLPEYCQTYSGFMATASKDIYELVGGISRSEYLTAISVIELDFVVDDPFREVDLNGIQCFQNLTSLSLTGQSFKDISPISALKNIQEIALIDTSVVSIDSFSNLSKIKGLNITGTKTLQSVEGVEEMTKLTSLSLVDNGIVNIEGLNNLTNLTNLDLSENNISVFPNINQLTNLTNLNVNYNSIHTLGDDLSGLSSLITLSMNNNDICDLSSLDDLTSLETLDLSYNNLGCDGSGLSPDFSSLENASNLETVLLNNNDLVSIEGLRGLDIPLTTLHLQNNNLIDITPISEYTEITDLVLNNNNIVNINNLSGMTGLTEIDLSSNSIVDFSDLLSIPNLEFVYLNDNLIESIPDLVTVDDEFWPHLSHLDLRSNVLNDTSGIEGHSTLKELILSNNGLNELSGLSDLPELDYLEIFSDVPEGDVEDWPIDYEPEDNPNSISIITNSFNNLPSLQLLYIEEQEGFDDIETDIFDFGFELGPDVEIYGSISGLIDVGKIDFSGMDINVIDEFSINLPNLYQISVAETGIEDIGFILGNPDLRSLDISDTAVSNLSVISGVDTSDLDELDQVNASNISGENHLLDAFIELPELSIIVLEGTNIITIENSFNSLDGVTTFRLGSVEITSIINSFNDIFYYADDENIIQLNDSKIGVISGSFNVGNYEFIEIIDNVSSGVTEITDSFNDLVFSSTGYINIDGNDFGTVSGSFNNIELSYLDFIDNASSGLTSIDGSFNSLVTPTTSDIQVSGNDFRIVTGSFNNIITGELFIANNFIEEMTTSLVSLDVLTELNIQNNRLETLVGLNLVTSVPILDLSNNLLTTVSFIDGISDLVELDISNQYDSDLDVYTLNTLDGINNMTGLDSLVMTNNQIHEIDGLKDIGITEFYLSYSDNLDEVITSVSSVSFTNTLITDLDLYNHNLDNIDFLTNFTNLTDLSISVDLADLSYFETAVFETDLESLTLGNLQDTTDFSSLAEYDNLTFLSFESVNTTVINNLDGMNSLNNLNFWNGEDITEFDNSFNTMPNLNLPESYINQYSSLAVIDTSFDMYSIGESVAIDGSINVIDSFNNVGEVILASSVETDFNIDALSFENLAILTIETSNHDSYAVLNNYLNLTDVTIETLNKNITDLDNSNITSLTIQETDVSVDTLTLDIALNGDLDLATLSSTTITFTTVNDSYNISIPSGSAVLNIDNTTADLIGVFNNFTLNSANLVTANLIDFTSTTTIFNTDLVNQINSTTPIFNANSMQINSLEASLDIDVNVGDLIINDVNANNYTLAATGNAYLNSNQANLIIDFTGNDLFAQYDLIETIDLNGSLNDVFIDSIALDTATLNNSTINTATISSNQAILSITGTSVSNLDIVNDSINNLTATIPGAYMTMNSTNNETLDVNVNASTFDIYGNSIPEVIFNTTSVLPNLNINSGNSVNTLTFNDASIDTLYLLSNEASLDIQGTDITDIELDMANLSVINANTLLSNYEINSSVASMDIDAIADFIDLTNLNMTNLNIIGTTSLDRLGVQGSLLNTVTTNTANINVSTLYSNSTNMNITSTNVLDTAISNDSLTNLVVDLGVYDLSVLSSKLGISSFTISANDVELLVSLSTINIDNSSAFNNLQVGNANLSSINAGTASIQDMVILNASSNLDVTSTNLTTLDVTGDITSFNNTVGLTTSVDFTHTGSTTSTITTNTEDITINSSADIDLTSSTLTASTLNLGSNDAVLQLSTPALTYVLDGSLNDISIDSITMNNLNIGIGFTSNEIELLNTNVTNLDFSNGTVSNYSMNGSTSSLVLLGNDLSDISLDMPNLNDLTVNSSLAFASIIVNTSNTTLDLNGSIETVTLYGDSLTSLDLTNISVNNLNIQGDSLTSLDTLTSVSNVMSIITNYDNFDLTTNVPVVSFNSAVGHHLIFTTTALNQEINTNVDSIALSAAPTTLNITGNNINSLSGTVGDVTLNSTESGALTVNLDSSVVTVNNTSLTSLDTTTSTFSSLVVSTNTDNFNLITDIASVDFTSAVTDNLNLTTTALTQDITTNVDSITLGAGSTTLSISAVNLNNLIGDVDEVILTSTDSGILTLDLNANLATIDNTSYTQFDTIGARTITDITVGGSNLATINTNSVSITNLDITNTASVINVDTLASNIDITSLVPSNANIVYTSVDAVNFTTTGMADISFNATLASNVTLSGDAVNMLLVGLSISDVTTTAFTTSNKYTMNDTLIDDVTFLSVGLIASLVELEVNTLDSVNVSNIVETLRDSGITLFSPITNTNIYDDFYDTEFADLTAQEAIDSVRYTGFRDAAISNALDEFRLNEYFDYVLDATLNASIDAQTYGDMQSYYDGYLLDIGKTEQQLTDENPGDPNFVQDIKDSIQATLDETVLVIVELDLTNSVDQSIIDDSNTHATTESGLIGFIIG